MITLTDTLRHRAYAADSECRTDDADIMRTAADVIDLATTALKEFTSAARYQPHMSGKPSFMGWSQGQLRHAEACAREALEKAGVSE